MTKPNFSTASGSAIAFAAFSAVSFQFITVSAFAAPKVNTDSSLAPLSSTYQAGQEVIVLANDQKKEQKDPCMLMVAHSLAAQEVAVRRLQKDYRDLTGRNLDGRGEVSALFFNTISCAVGAAEYFADLEWTKGGTCGSILRGDVNYDRAEEFEKLTPDAKAAKAEEIEKEFAEKQTAWLGMFKVFVLVYPDWWLRNQTLYYNMFSDSFYHQLREDPFVKEHCGPIYMPQVTRSIDALKKNENFCKDGRFITLPELTEKVKVRMLYTPGPYTRCD